MRTQTREEMQAAVARLRLLVMINLAATVALLVAMIRAHPELTAGLTLAVALMSLAILAVAHRIGGRE